MLMLRRSYGQNDMLQKLNKASVVPSAYSITFSFTHIDDVALFPIPWYLQSLIIELMRLLTTFIHITLPQSAFHCFPDFIFSSLSYTMSAVTTG